MPRPWRCSKKLRRACGGNPRGPCTRHTARGLVPRRDAGGAKEQAHLSLGQERFTPACCSRSTDPIDLSVRCGLPRTWSRRRPRAAGLQLRSHAAPSRRDRNQSRPSEHTPFSSLIRPAGMAPKPWSSQVTSHSCRCRRAHPNSTARKTSGSSCARIGCQTGFSNPSTISSTTAATLGTHSSTSPGRSCPSPDATGQQSVTQSEDWYKHGRSKCAG
jgi:hypothetical protein